MTKMVLDEKGGNEFEVLPLGWVIISHNCGMPLYLHRYTALSLYVYRFIFIGIPLYFHRYTGLPLRVCEVNEHSCEEDSEHFEPDPGSVAQINRSRSGYFRRLRHV